MRNIIKSINEKNKAFKNNIMIINFNYNVVEDIVIIVKIKNETLRNITLRRNFQNKHIKKNVFDENIKFSIK